MNLVIIGGNTAEKIKPHIENLDGVRVHVYHSIDEFQENATIMSIKYDRLLLMSVGLFGMSEDEKVQKLNNLLDYTNRNMQEMRIVTLSKTESDFELFQKMIRSPIAVNVKSEKINARMLENLVVSSIEELRKLYGVEQESISSVIQQEVDLGEAPPQKKGLFERMLGGLFGKKKGTPERVEEVKQAVEEGAEAGEVRDEQDEQDETAEQEQMLNELTDYTYNEQHHAGIGVIQNANYPPTAVNTQERGAKRQEAKQEDPTPRATEQTEQTQGKPAIDIEPTSNNNKPFGEWEYPPKTNPRPAPATNTGEVEQEQSNKSSGKSGSRRGFPPNYQAPETAPETAPKTAPKITLTGYKELSGEIPQIQLNTVSETAEQGYYGGGLEMPDVEAKAKEEADIGLELEELIATGRKNTPAEVDTSVLQGFQVESKDIKLNIAEGVGVKPQEAGVEAPPRPAPKEETDEDAAMFIRSISHRRTPTGVGDMSTFSVFSLDDVGAGDIQGAEIEEVEDLGIVPDITQTAPPERQEVQKPVQPQIQVVEKVVEKPVIERVEVIKEVEKPVIVGYGSQGGKHDFKKILKGQEQITIVVTGDRRSGVTTTALTLATMFGQKIETLYVDLDTRYRGSLLHLGLQNILDCEEAVQKGLYYLRDARGLERLVYRGTNGFGSLIANFDSEIPDERIKEVAEILAGQQTYNAVIIDTPIAKLPLLNNLLLFSDVLLCIDGTAQSVINTMTEMQELEDKGVKPMILNMMMRNTKYLLTGDVSEKDFQTNREFADRAFDLSKEKYPWIIAPVLGHYNNLSKVIKNI